MVKISLLFKKFTNFTGNNIPFGNNKAKRLGYFFAWTQAYRVIFKSALVCF